MDHLTLWLAVLVLAALAAPPTLARAAETEAYEPPDEDPVVTTRINRGDYAWRYLYNTGRRDQKIGLWIPHDCETVRGVVLSLHRESEAHRTDLHEFARAMDFAVYGMLIRWAGYEKVLPDQIAKLGRALGHPEVANVPWAAIGGSRNVGALTRYTQADPNKNRILCILASGGPGVGIRLDDPDQVALFRKIPIMTINGSEDPFVGGMKWLERIYPRIRRTHLSWGGATEWGGGHALHKGNVMYWPFVRAVMRARYPDRPDPRKGFLRLDPMTEEAGWLVGPVHWDDPGREPAAPVADFKGDPAKAVWLPDRYAVEVWRAFVTREPAARLVAESGQAGTVAFHLADEPESGFAKVAFFDGDRPLGTSTAPPHALRTPALAAGAHSVYAVCTDASGAARRTRPIVVASGRYVDQEEGMRAAHRADQPVNVLLLSDRQRRTLRALLARADASVPGTWRLVFEDDFSDGLDPAWYEYYEGRKRGEHTSTMKAVDGTMELEGTIHAVAMLPYDWPDDVAVEYRARAVSERFCDLSVVLSGNPGGTDFPWREGMMFQFGAHWNQGSFFLVREQPHRNWKEHDCGARIEPGTWHRVRVERLGGTARAFIDGRLVAEKEIDPADFERFYGRRIGLYTFGSTARFDDVKVYVRAPKDPAALEPAMPGEAALEDLAAGLVEALSHRHAQQNGAARRIVERFSFDLGPALERLIEKGRVKDDRVRKRLERLLAARRPG